MDKNHRMIAVTLHLRFVARVKNFGTDENACTALVDATDPYKPHIGSGLLIVFFCILGLLLWICCMRVLYFYLSKFRQKDDYHNLK